MVCLFNLFFEIFFIFTFSFIILYIYIYKRKKFGNLKKNIKQFLKMVKNFDQ